MDLFIPIILGTVRQGRMSEAIAHFILNYIKHQQGIETDLIDIRQLPIPTMDAGTEAQIPELTEIMRRADGYIIVTPEYNHSYPGLLKHVLDLNYKEYVHKAVGVCGVSAGPFGGVRAIEALLPTFKAFGLSPIVSDLNFSQVTTLVDASGQLTTDAQHTYTHRLERFMQELLWLATTLKYGREQMSMPVT